MPYQTKPRSARRRAPQQIDLFAAEPQMASARMPVWCALPKEIQAALIDLMTRLLLEHTDRSRTSSMAESDHDL
jgi:hypothetical protein